VYHSVLQPEEAAAPKVTQQPPLPQLYHGQLYNAVLKLALSPLHPDAAVSCSVSAAHSLHLLESWVVLLGFCFLSSPSQYQLHIALQAAHITFRSCNCQANYQALPQWHR
jgi:hypothetical protein